MVDGKLAKFLDGVVLLRQRFVMDEDLQIKDILPKGIAVKQFVKFTVGEIS
jgi:translation elongation factor EF-Ts